MDTPQAARRAMRTGAFTGNTAGIAPGYTQGNLAILPADLALDFMRYCQRNPKPCPLIGVSGTGDPSLPTLGRDIDIRTDIPSYNVYRDGELDETVTDIRHLWRDDFVAFILGCSYSFEQALADEGVRLRHLDEGLTVSMWRTSIETSPSGAFGGGMVVSMRPLTAPNAIRAVEITSRFPHTHGAPVHLGDPSLIGIEDINVPDWGDAQRIEADEMPVFWACGVTPQNAIQQAKPEICITHKPGSMLISDLPSAFNSRLED
ncbi:MAG: putative hydro-lyase [Rhizobiales bacterium]|nr:putative hydro-lyase [Hyphomicrobiales bacterium]